MRNRILSIVALACASSVAFAQDTLTSGFKQLTQDNYTTVFTGTGIPSMSGKWEVINGDVVEVSMTSTNGNYDVATYAGASNILLVSNGTFKHTSSTNKAFLVRGNKTDQSANSTIEVGENGKFIVNKMELRGTLILRAENSLSSHSGGFSNIMLESNNGLPKIAIYNNQKINIDIKNAVVGTFQFGADKELSLMNITTASGEKQFTLTLEDFVDNGSIFFGGATESMFETIKSSNTLKVNDTTLTLAIKDEEIDSNKWNWVAAEREGVSGFILSYGAAIPEPAEWAAIFGAIALGLAIYRRRK